MAGKPTLGCGLGMVAGPGRSPRGGGGGSGKMAALSSPAMTGDKLGQPLCHGPGNQAAMPGHVVRQGRTATAGEDKNVRRVPTVSPYQGLGTVSQG